MARSPDGWRPCPTITWTDRPPRGAPRLLDGDADGNGTVNGADLGIVLSNYNKTFSGDAWTYGDFNGDGTVNGADLNMVLRTKPSSTRSPAFPSLRRLPCSSSALAALAWRRQATGD